MLGKKAKQWLQKVYDKKRNLRSPDNNQGFFIAEYSSKMRQIIQNKTIPNYIDIKVKIYV